MNNDLDAPEGGREVTESPLFPHPPWTLGIVLVIAVCALLAGISDPIWLLLGAPFILALLLFLYVRIAQRLGKAKGPE
jgi:hypothetical protein